MTRSLQVIADSFAYQQDPPNPFPRLKARCMLFFSHLSVFFFSFLFPFCPGPDPQCDFGFYYSKWLAHLSTWYWLSCGPRMASVRPTKQKHSRTCFLYWDLQNTWYQLWHLCEVSRLEQGIATLSTVLSPIRAQGDFFASSHCFGNGASMIQIASCSSFATFTH